MSSDHNTLLMCCQVDNGTQTEVAAIYNMTSNAFVPFHIPESPFCAGHLLLPDGKGLVIGGEAHACVTMTYILPLQHL
jgi:hypothetical protein